MTKSLVMNPGFFIGSLALAFIVAMFGNLFLSFTTVVFTVCILSFGERCKKISKIGDEEVGWK